MCEALGIMQSYPQLHCREENKRMTKNSEVFANQTRPKVPPKDKMECRSKFMGQECA